MMLDDRVAVQCHVDESRPNAQPEWFTLYRRSTSQLQTVDLTEDVMHRARVPVG